MRERYYVVAYVVIRSRRSTSADLTPREIRAVSCSCAVQAPKCSCSCWRSSRLSSLPLGFFGSFNDSTYGGNEVLKGTVFSKYKQFVDNCFKLIPRQALHAKTLGFVHPATKKFLQFDSELPADFKEVIEKWENYVKFN